MDSAAPTADVEPADRGGEQADVGQHREAPADPRIVIHHLDLMGRKHVAEPVGLAGFCRFGDAKEMRVRIELGGFHNVECGDGLHQRLAGAAGL
jgi:hypothetical protein